MESSKGVIYIATGKKYIAEACASAASLKAHMPTLPITLWASDDVSNPYFENVYKINHPSYNFLDKVRYIYKSPYEYTLFLDTDTYICEDFDELFGLLEKFDVAIAHAPYRRSPKNYVTCDEFVIDEIPMSFPEMNTGVILFKKHARVEQFFDRWLIEYQQQLSQSSPPANDQPAFRAALYFSDLSHATLPPEYNCRFVFPVFVSGMVKILHGWHQDFPALAAQINASLMPRVLIVWDIFKQSGLEQLGEIADGMQAAQVLVSWDFEKSHSRVIDDLRHTLQQTQAALNDAQRRLNAMQRSPIWKLRNLLVWFKHDAQS